jgi:hypothetical protein
MGVPQSSLHPCALSERLIHALADGELGADSVAADVRGHVAACSGCRGRWDAVVGVRRLLVAATRREDACPMPPELAAWLGDFTQLAPAAGTDADAEPTAWEL